MLIIIIGTGIAVAAAAVTPVLFLPCRTGPFFRSLIYN